MQCTECGKKFHGSGLNVTLEGKLKMLCADCYGKIKEEYKKRKNGEDCNHLDEASCGLTGSKLEPVSIGIDDFFVQAEKCGHYADEDIESEEKTGVNTFIKQLADRGQTLTYYCCHCGAPLKIGTETSDVLKCCPHCGYSLDVINLAELIKLHL
jgi:DNA-directed RNA polymerase subunit RPC12/RpoP